MAVARKPVKPLRRRPYRPRTAKAYNRRLRKKHMRRLESSRETCRRCAAICRTRECAARFRAHGPAKRGSQPNRRRCPPTAAPATARSVPGGNENAYGSQALVSIDLLIIRTINKLDVRRHSVPTDICFGQPTPASVPQRPLAREPRSCSALRPILLSASRLLKKLVASTGAA
jgi:hypothetical protein